MLSSFFDELLPTAKPFVTRGSFWNSSRIETVFFVLVSIKNLVIYSFFFKKLDKVPTCRGSEFESRETGGLK